MPQGVTNAPRTFQQIMEKCMADINLCEFLVFIDDIIVFPKDLKEHEESLVRVLNRLKSTDLSLHQRNVFLRKPQLSTLAI